MRRRRPALLLAAALLGGCAAARRGADNGMVVATTPIHVVATPAALFAERWEADPFGATTTAPLFVPLWIAGDLVFTGVSAADLALTPAYAPFDVHRPRLYETKRFPPTLRRSALDDAADALAWTTVVLAPVAAVALIWSGRGSVDASGGAAGSDPLR